MNTKISTLIDLKKVVNELEKDLGLGSMTSHEKAVLLAISDLQQLDGVAKTKAIMLVCRHLLMPSKISLASKVSFSSVITQRPYFDPFSSSSSSIFFLFLRFFLRFFEILRVCEKL